MAITAQQRRFNSRPPKNDNELAAEALERFREQGPDGLSTHQLTLARDRVGAGTAEGARISLALARRGA